MAVKSVTLSLCMYGTLRTFQSRHKAKTENRKGRIYFTVLHFTPRLKMKTSEAVQHSQETLLYFLAMQAHRIIDLK